MERKKDPPFCYERKKVPTISESGQRILFDQLSKQPSCESWGASLGGAGGGNAGPDLNLWLWLAHQRRIAATHPVRSTLHSRAPTCFSVPEHRDLTAFSWDCGHSRLQPGQQDYCVRATVLPGFGHRRSWCFRSDTGFTALGVSPANGGGAISGVVHSTGSVGSLEEFDVREAGYRRVLIPPELLSFADAPEAERRGLRQAVDEGATSVYVYVPEPGSVRPASEDFPICQTYLDTVLEGCLEVGGPSMAEEFVVNTYDWSEFFLDDTPTSRRPWLHRKRYIEIDAVLEQYAERTFVKQVSSSTQREPQSLCQRNPS